MKCSKCDGKAKVIKSIVDTETNETYRKFRCDICSHEFYSLEFEVEFNGAYEKRYNEVMRAFYSKHNKKREKECREALKFYRAYKEKS